MRLFALLFWGYFCAVGALLYWTGLSLAQAVLLAMPIGFLVPIIFFSLIRLIEAMSTTTMQDLVNCIRGVIKALPTLLLLFVTVFLLDTCSGGGGSHPCIPGRFGDC